MTRSYAKTPKPSPILALVALCLVHRFRPAWIAVTVSAAAEAEGVPPEKLSRLTTRGLAALEAIAAGLVRRGRPALEPDAAAGGRTALALTAALLEVATGLLVALRPRGKLARDLVVGAWLRLAPAHPSLTKARFAASLAIPLRTLDHWLRHSGVEKPVAPAPSPKSPRRKRPPRRQRFGFDTVLPDTQFAGDTTDFRAFGVPLKLIGVQDVGGRDADLFDSVIVEPAESALLVVAAAKRALKSSPGAQLITDQGTPYMAKLTKAALDALEVEHAPQREADPLGKATVERAFGLVKTIAAPLLGLTDRLAESLPALRDEALAQAFAKLVFTMLLSAYQAGARAARRANDARGGIAEERLVELAQASRERARAVERSARLFLEHVHELYNITKPKQAFVDSLRRYPLEVLRDAERRVRGQVHRADIKDRASYFAAIVRNAHAAWRQRRAADEHAHAGEERRREEIGRVLDERAAMQRDPVAWLHSALRMLATQWHGDAFIAGGHGLGAATMRAAVARLVEIHGAETARDLAQGAFQRFRLHDQTRHLGETGLRALASRLDHELAIQTTDTPTPTFARPAPSAMLPLAGKNARSPPPNLLSI